MSEPSVAARITADQYPDRWDAPRIIAHVHQMGRELGLSRERQDRHRYPTGTRGYFEVGYGPIMTVTVRTSWDPTNPWIVTRENYRPERFWDLLEMLLRGFSEFSQVTVPRAMLGLGGE